MIKIAQSRRESVTGVGESGAARGGPTTVRESYAQVVRHRLAARHARQHAQQGAECKGRTAIDAKFKHKLGYRARCRAHRVALCCATVEHRRRCSQRGHTRAPGRLGGLPYCCRTANQRKNYRDTAGLRATTARSSRRAQPAVSQRAARSAVHARAARGDYSSTASGTIAVTHAAVRARPHAPSNTKSEEQFKSKSQGEDQQTQTQTQMQNTLPRAKCCAVPPVDRTSTALRSRTHSTHTLGCRGGLPRHHKASRRREVSDSTS